jgi:hypothetical protein
LNGLSVGGHSSKNRQAGATDEHLGKAITAEVSYVDDRLVATLMSLQEEHPRWRVLASVRCVRNRGGRLAIAKSTGRDEIDGFIPVQVDLPRSHWVELPNEGKGEAAQVE